MLIGERIRMLRERRGLTQGDIEERTGLLRCYTSRVENGHTVPSLETIEKIARALEMPLYQVFYDGEKPPDVEPLVTDGRRKLPFGKNEGDAKYIQSLLRFVEKMDSTNRKQLLQKAREISKPGAASA
ncbi:MAG TPA: helix-turn-helix transcriptional regulator [Candidatus Aquilonibacter sp.]|nr:helix-turn-helix transcriptional regulator [Candidatus Aquilonibacter sp.]